MSEKCQGNAANHSGVESRTKLEVTDGRMDGQTDRQTDRQTDQFQYTPHHYVVQGYKKMPLVFIPVRVCITTDVYLENLLKDVKP